MDSVKVITTLHQDGYNLYGKNFIQTWIKFFPQEWQIDYYAEKHEPEFDKRIHVLDFNKSCTGWQEYYDHILSCVNSLDTKKDKKTINRYKKALRWSFKMFALLHALENANTRYLIWMDSDVYAKAHPSEQWITAMLDNKCMAGQVERVKNFTHVETGILIIDLEHPDLPKLISWIKKGYVEKDILKEPKPWDGAWIGKLYDLKLIAFNNIWMLTRNNHAKAFSNQRLQWLVHKVGDDKFPEEYSGRSGRTLESELV